MKKSLLGVFVAALLLVSTALFASGTSEKTTEPTAPAGKVTLTFWNGFTASDGEVLREIVNTFNERNAGAIQINMDIMPWAVFYQKLPPAIATGTAPSFVIGGPADLLTFVPNNSIQPVDDFFQATGVSRDAFIPVSLEMGQYNGKQYMLPMQVFYLVLYWNKDLFKAAGLDPERPPQTWEELADYAERLTDPSKAQYGYGVAVKTAPATFASLVWGNGGDVVDLEARKSVLDTPQNVESFRYLADLVVNKKVSPPSITGPELDNLLISGKLAMYMNGPWLINGLKTNDINFGIAAPPHGSTDQVTVLDGSAYYIPRTTPDREKAAVYEYLKYWESPEIGKEWSMRNGFPPYLKSVLEDPEVAGDPVLSQMVQFADIGRLFMPNLRGNSRITSDVLWPLVEQVTTGADPAEAVRSASTQIDAILASD